MRTLDAMEEAIRALSTMEFGAAGRMCWGHPCGSSAAKDVEEHVGMARKLDPVDDAAEDAGDAPSQAARYARTAVNYLLPKDIHKHLPDDAREVRTERNIAESPVKAVEHAKKALASYKEGVDHPNVKAVAQRIIDKHGK